MTYGVFVCFSRDPLWPPRLPIGQAAECALYLLKTQRVIEEGVARSAPGRHALARHQGFDCASLGHAVDHVQQLPCPIHIPRLGFLHVPRVQQSLEVLFPPRSGDWARAPLGASEPVPQRARLLPLEIGFGFAPRAVELPAGSSVHLPGSASTRPALGCTPVCFAHRMLHTPGSTKERPPAQGLLDLLACLCLLRSAARVRATCLGFLQRWSLP
jgi:hypothetical protein